MSLREHVREGAALAGPRRVPFDAVTFLTVYLVLVCIVPSYLTIPALGSLGRPATIWALGGFVWWALHVVSRPTTVSTGSVWLRRALLAFFAVVLVSYGLTGFQGLPAAEASPADSGMLRMAGWAGVALIANDGIQSRERLDRLLRRIVIIGGLMAALGLAQFVTGSSLIDSISIPGFSRDPGFDNVQNRAGFLRSAGTASHPLEYGVVLAMALPLAVALALSERQRSFWLRWVPVALIAFASVLSISRSALIGVTVGLLFLVPGWPTKVRLAALGATIGVFAAIFLLVPGMAGTLRGLFVNIESDPSALSRTSSYAGAFEIALRNPVFGRGFGTFLPEYLIVDNQYLLLVVELGFVGALAFLVLLGTAFVMTWRSGLHIGDDARMQKGIAIAASLAAGGVTILFFDGLSYPMSAAFLFSMIGMAGAASSITHQHDLGHPARQ